MAVTLYTNLVSWWELDETLRVDRVDSHGPNDLIEGDLYDDSGNLGIGTSPDGGNCLAVNGLGTNHFDIADANSWDMNPRIEGAGVGITIACWIKLTDKTGIQIWIDNQSGTTGSHLATIGDNEVIFNTAGVQLKTTTSPLTTGAWHLIVGTTNDANTLRTLYFDGVDVKNDATSLPVQASVADMVIGAGANTGGFPTKGLMSKCAFWQRELTAAEVLQLYNSGSGLTYATLGPTQPLLINTSTIASRLSAGCNINIDTDSLFDPSDGDRMAAGFLRKIPYNMNGVYISGGTGILNHTIDAGAHTPASPTYGIATEVTTPAPTGTTYTQASSTLHNEADAFTNASNVVCHPRHEFKYTSTTVADGLELTRFVFKPTDSPNFTEWRDSAWVGATGMRMRMLYYAHDECPGAAAGTGFTIDNTGSDNAPAATSVTDARLAATVENFDKRDITIEKANPGSAGADIGLVIKTATGADVIGDGVIMVGARCYVPGGTGVELSTTSSGGATVAGHLEANAEISAANRAKWCELMQTDTVIIWFRENNTDPSTTTTRLETLGDQWVTAITAARAIDSTIQKPLIVFVSTWEESSLREVDALHHTVREMVANHTAVSGDPEWAYVDMHKIIKNKHGDYANWQATFLSDGLHTNTAGADEFSSLFFQQIAGGHRRRWMRNYPRRY